MTGSSAPAIPLLTTQKVFLPTTVRLVALLLAVVFVGAITTQVLETAPAERGSVYPVYLFPLLGLAPIFFISHRVRIFSDRIQFYFIPLLRVTVLFQDIEYWAMPSQPVEVTGMHLRGLRHVPQAGLRFANRGGLSLTLHSNKPQRLQVVLASQEEAAKVSDLLVRVLPLQPGTFRNPT